MSDQRTSSGEFAIRPVGAAPLFDAESGKQAALKRWEELKARNKLLVIKNVAEELGVEPGSLTYDEAFDHAMLKPLVKKSLKQFPAEEMEFYAVSKAVNSPRNDTVQCIEFNG